MSVYVPEKVVAVYWLTSPVCAVAFVAEIATIQRTVSTLRNMRGNPIRIFIGVSEKERLLKKLSKAEASHPHIDKREPPKVKKKFMIFKFFRENYRLEMLAQTTCIPGAATPGMPNYRVEPSIVGDAWSIHLF